MYKKLEYYLSQCKPLKREFIMLLLVLPVGVPIIVGIVWTFKHLLHA